MENKFASIRWETTQNIDYVGLEDLKRFSIDDSTSRKQKSTDFYLLVGQGQHRGPMSSQLKY